MPATFVIWGRDDVRDASHIDLETVLAKQLGDDRETLQDGEMSLFFAAAPPTSEEDVMDHPFPPPFGTKIVRAPVVVTLRTHSCIASYLEAAEVRASAIDEFLSKPGLVDAPVVQAARRLEGDDAWSGPSGDGDVDADAELDACDVGDVCADAIYAGVAIDADADCDADADADVDADASSVSDEDVSDCDNGDSNSFEEEEEDALPAVGL